jgi:hypothetical protein
MVRKELDLEEKGFNFRRFVLYLRAAAVLPRLPPDCRLLPDGLGLAHSIRVTANKMIKSNQNSLDPLSSFLICDLFNGAISIVYQNPPVHFDTAALSAFTPKLWIM